ncbi:DUF6520 family protein [Winogradskyella wichelsiae]|uniref:DUF6520 family protein n=1 Tax=Winogradskyella wichelsiae TaxID=2697007 RepID=UPI003EFAB66F
MKIQKFKFLMPVIAIIFAFTASAFTTPDHTNVDDDFAMITGYTANTIPGQPCQSVNVDCSVGGDKLCTVNGEQVFRLLNGTSCVIQLKRTN